MLNQNELLVELLFLRNKLNEEQKDFITLYLYSFYTINNLIIINNMNYNQTMNLFGKIFEEGIREQKLEYQILDRIEYYLKNVNDLDKEMSESLDTFLTFFLNLGIKRLDDEALLSEELNFKIMKCFLSGYLDLNNFENKMPRNFESDFFDKMLNSIPNISPKKI